MDKLSASAAASANAVAQLQLLQQHQQPTATYSGKKDCIRLRGLPYEAQAFCMVWECSQVQHIIDFLGSDTAKHIVLQGVHMVYNAQGFPSGEAFIQMDGETSARAAVAGRHNKYMSVGRKQRYIEVFQCSGDDMNMSLALGQAASHSVLATLAASLGVQSGLQQQNELIASQHSNNLAQQALLASLGAGVSGAQSNYGAGALPQHLVGLLYPSASGSMGVQLPQWSPCINTGALPYPSPPSSPTLHNGHMAAYLAAVQQQRQLQSLQQQQSRANAQPPRGDPAALALSGGACRL